MAELSKTYDLITKEYGIVKVMAKPIFLDGFSNFDFIVHINIDKDVLEYISITEVSTGALVASDFDIKQAKDNAIRNLNRVGCEKFSEMINRALIDIKNNIEKS